MKQNRVVAIVFILGCATGGVASQVVIPPVRAGTAPTRWEYYCLRVEGGGGVTSTLNKMGTEGWELVGVAPAHHSAASAFSGSEVNMYMFCAKRALP
jgi:hypothetical protein